MVWYVVIGTLAAFGLVSALWLIFGWLIPGGKGWAAVCFREGAALERCLWLREWGLLRGPVLLLGEPDREVFLRHYFLAQTVQKISQIMNMNESTVKTKLRRGRGRLKETFTRWGVR